nr:MAG TPA: hypothetical protein [Caudoviricetes sp.]
MPRSCLLCLTTQGRHKTPFIPATLEFILLTITLTIQANFRKIPLPFTS